MFPFSILMFLIERAIHPFPHSLSAQLNLITFLFYDYIHVFVYTQICVNTTYQVSQVLLMVVYIISRLTTLHWKVSEGVHPRERLIVLIVLIVFSCL